MSLKEDFLLANKIRMIFNTTLKTLSATLCLIRIRNKLEKVKPHYVKQIESRYISNFPDISVTNGLLGGIPIEI